MLYDLNVPWSPTTTPAGLERTINFLSEMGYGSIALNHHISSPLPSTLSNPIPLPKELSIQIPPKINLLRRCTLSISDPSQNHRLPNLSSLYDILAIRPATEKAFLAACQSMTEQSIISLDLTKRFPFHFKPKPLMTAVNRGVFIELCYAQAVGGDSSARKNVISNVMAIVRCTRGRGLIVSSEARSVLAVRGPADVVNLLGVWGLSRERGNESLGVNPRSVVMNEGLKRRGWRGIVDVIESGESFVAREEVKVSQAPASAQDRKGKGKRGAEMVEENSNTPPMSKRAAKRAKLEAIKKAKELAAAAQHAPAATSSAAATIDTRIPATSQETSETSRGSNL